MLKSLKRLFGGINLTWTKLIVFAICSGVYTAIMALLPIAENTSFENISIYIEAWILFGIIIIMNSKSPMDSALKCFVFFLISQPLIYLIQVPFSSLGWKIFSFYGYWFILTLLTIPMGYIGYYLKENKWWGLLILTPILLLLGYHYAMYLGNTIFYFPRHLLSTLFCFVTLLIYPLCIFEDKKIRNIGLIISISIIFLSSIYSFINRNAYSTVLLTNNGELGASFDNTYKVYLEDGNFGTVEIIYDSGLEDYMVTANLVKGGKTNLILEDSSGNKVVYELDINYNKFEISKKE